MPPRKTPIRLDSLNRKIIETIHTQADVTNQRLAEKIGLSPAACSQRVTALKQAGYFKSFTSDIDLEKTFEHVLAYVEFTLSNNAAHCRRAFEKEIEKHPEFMDCLRLSGDVDYVSFTCARNIKELNRVCDKITSNTDLGVSRIVTRVILERAKWYLGYPIAKLKWLD